MKLIYDGVDLNTIGVYSFATDCYDPAERDVQSFEIPGRNGNLFVDNNRWKNITVAYPSVIKENFAENAAKLRRFFGTRSNLYCKLIDDADADHFRMARLLPFKFATFPRMYGADFELRFDCKPQRFLAATDQMRSSAYWGVPQNLRNPTGFPALPLFAFRITTPAVIDIEIGNRVFSYDGNVVGLMYLDFESQNAYKAENQLRAVGYKTTSGGDAFARLTVSADDAEMLIDYINKNLTSTTFKYLNRDTGATTSHIVGKAAIKEEGGESLLTVSRPYNGGTDITNYIATAERKLLVIGDATSDEAMAYISAVMDAGVVYENCNSYISGKDFSPLTGNTYVPIDGTAITEVYCNPRWWEL